MITRFFSWMTISSLLTIMILHNASLNGLVSQNWMVLSIVSTLVCGMVTAFSLFSVTSYNIEGDVYVRSVTIESLRSELSFSFYSGLSMIFGCFFSAYLSHKLNILPEMEISLVAYAFLSLLLASSCFWAMRDIGKRSHKNKLKIENNSCTMIANYATI